jgi:hypothetical protein
MLVGLLILCAGCWQKIEYSAHSPSSAKSASSKQTTTSDSTEVKHVTTTMPCIVTTSPVAADTPATAVAQSRPAAEATHATTTPISRPKADDDRYAIQAKGNDTSSATQPAGSEMPAGALEHQQPATRHTDGAAVLAAVDVAPRAVAPNNRRAAWLLGSRLSLAALAHDRGMAADNVPGWFEEARSQAKLLGTSLPDLPEPAAAGDDSPASKQVIDYLLVQGQRISHDLSQRYGPEDAALLEVALKSNILLLLYSPGSSAGNSISAAISRAAPQARLPGELWKPLVDDIALQAPLSDVRAAVRQMHNDVDQYLAKAAEPSGR